MQINITNEQQVHVTLTPITSTGRPAQLDGPATWEVVTGDSTIENVSEDGKQVDLVSSDLPGDTEIMVRADADLGSGVVEISDMIRLSVAGAQAANLGLVAGDPTPKA